MSQAPPYPEPVTGHGVDVLDVPAASDVPGLLDRLSAALDGTAPALLPVPRGRAGAPVLAAARPDAPVGDDVALLLPTTGSTGRPQVAELTGAALRASAAATHERLGGPGRWVLALPLAHVAGWQVLVRSLDAGHAPAVVDLTGGFAPERFDAAVAGDARYAALVPTQLSRLLDDDAGRTALSRLDAVLLGGAAAPAPLLERAAAAGARVVRTYGSTETSGGCVYDGVPLSAVEVAADDEGRLRVAGPVLARGYRDPAARGFEVREGRRWFVTSDAGTVGPGGTVTVLGRLDDMVVTGGRKVAPAAVERVLSGLPGVRDVLVVGVPDPVWGQAVVALVVGNPPPVDDVRRAVAAELDGAAAPRHVLAVDALPLRGIGKPDRVAAGELAARLVPTDALGGA